MRIDNERQLAAQHAISRALAESDTVDEAIGHALQALGEHLHWTVGTFWLLKGQETVLRPAKGWGSTAAPEFARATLSLTFECGEGLPGRVWQTRRPIIVRDLASLTNFPRAAAAAAAAPAGLRVALAFPVVAPNAFIGVIELFSTDARAADVALEETFEEIGRHVGQFVARRRALEADLDAVRLSAAMVAVAIDCIITIDSEGRILEFNPAAERTFGYRRPDLLGKPMVDFIVPPSLRDAHRAGMARYLNTGEPHVLGRRIEITGHRANDELFPVELTILRVDRPGPPVFTAYLRDLTEQKRLESVQQLLLRSTEILAASLDYEETLRNLSRVIVPDFADWYAVDIVGSDGALRRLEVSHRDPAKVALAADLAKRYPDDPNQPQGVHEVVRSGKSQLIADLPDSLLAELAQNAEHLELIRQLGLRSAMIVPLLAGQRAVGAMTLVTAESGRRYDERDLAVAEDLARRAATAIEQANLFAEVNEAREMLESQAVELEAQAAELQQTTAQLEISVANMQKANEALRNESAEAQLARRQADEANRAKSDFLASMSHELRTPLNAIMGYAQLLEVGVHGTLDPRQLEDLQRIDRSSQHLLGLINDILNFAKIEAGRIEYALDRIAVDGVLARVEELIAPQAAAKHLTYTFVNECSDVFVCADEDKLMQVFVNLVSNAVRYTREGGQIRVECSATADRVTTTVCDNGIGIPPDKLVAIFEPFVQVERGYAGNRQGTGLGLAISRNLARGMGGDLTVTSEVGKGSVFSVELKREP